MRVPIAWLNEYVRPDLDTHALAERLALTGTEVERVEHHGVAALENFVVGHVLEAEQHPNADRLRVCLVDIGGAQPQQIVCGAPNVAAGQRWRWPSPVRSCPTAPGSARPSSAGSIPTG